ncbi:Hypothetical protein BCD_1663 (plasmid) [Borrelia crocidurae DOU]|uniref:Uncharacterized protein n=1 Tax=Borrelia crocidurae DOU TaxID=1293575 RepID=W5SKP0_9SPIR|nr:hypothetical protein [Borrelia crocidurae]AHH07729.1 Hypothetical protein BCD_1663 [Borrelia crocidurae DOU]
MHKRLAKFLNLETVINEYGKEYDIEDIFKHLLKQFSNKYKYKVWMMMKRTDGVINGYEFIWEGRFKAWYLLQIQEKLHDKKRKMWRKNKISKQKF